ncbi:MAG: hypothetical protein INR69_20440 [Mucilaginibacter polytrichastri]|nr:hypothetical protein [Mucilaginibacter polytrichastri]
MKIENPQRLIRNLFLSVLIYALPVALMFLSFSISGEKPWKKAAAKKAAIEAGQTETPFTKKTKNND